MDEIVYQRETLRRKLVDALALLDVAAKEYDPELDINVADHLLSLHAIGLASTIIAYTSAVTDRTEARAKLMPQE